MVRASDNANTTHKRITSTNGPVENEVLMQIHRLHMKNRQLRDANKTEKQNIVVQTPPSIANVSFSTKWPFVKFKKQNASKEEVPPDPKNNSAELRRQLNRFTVSVVAQERQIQQLHQQNQELKHIVETQQRRLQRLNYQMAIKNHIIKDPTKSDEVPDLPKIFPIADDETARLQEVLRLGLMINDLPLPMIEDAIDNHLVRIANDFPYLDSVFFTAVGSSTYRVLAARIHEKNGSYVTTRYGGIQNTRYAQFGHRNLSACQYTLSEAKTMCFSDVRVPPMITLLKRFPKLFETLAQYDPTLNYYIEQSMNRKAWKIIMNILTEETHLVSEISPDLCTMFELFAYYQNNYIGAPVRINGYVVGVVCFLHNLSSDCESDWKNWSKIEDLANDLGTILALGQTTLVE